MEWVFLGALAVLWMISPIILIIALSIARRHIRRLREQLASQTESESPPIRSTVTPVAQLQAGSGRYALVDLENLLLLRLELQQLLRLGRLDADHHQHLICELDSLWEQHLDEAGVPPGGDRWQRRRALGWSLLGEGMAKPPGVPPWLKPHPATATAVSAETPSASVPSALAPAPVIPPPPAWTASLSDTEAPAAPSLPAPPPLPGLDRQILTPPKRPSEPRISDVMSPSEVSIDVADWQPAPPSALERVLSTVSGWPKLIAPFLAQNIGWFVGGFCFIAGALFLIANTSGWVNALVVFASLYGANAFLTWAGYQFRRRRSELHIPSTMLLTLGMLLAPLVIAVAARLVMAANGDWLWLSMGALIALATIASYAWVATLSNTLIDGVLHGRYTQLLIILAAMQMAIPFAEFAPDWPVLMALHIVLLGLLGYGLWAFSGEWLRQLFVDQRLTTYYAVGMLVYTALVSFVHLTWLWPTALPQGYTGPFLMALCGLLFPVDAALKEWVHKYTFLSRFSFVLYGLSASAIVIASQSTLPLVLTLVLGALLYGWMTWRYRTLLPLYLWLGCLAGLYGLGLLHLVPTAWQGLAGLPGLAVVLGGAHWARSRSRTLALQAMIAFAVLLLGLLAWTLAVNPHSGLVSVTVLLSTGLAYAALRLAMLWPDSDPHWPQAGYGVAALATIGVASAPPWIGWDWRLQTAWGCLGLATLWAYLGLYERRQSTLTHAVWINSALTSSVLALMLGGATLWPSLGSGLNLVLLLAVTGGLWLWLSLSLRRQAWFYGALLCAAGVGVLLKLTYFPKPGTGLIQFGLAMGIWGLLWRLQWRWRAQQLLQLAPVGEMLSDSTKETEPKSLRSLISPPLEQAMASLWLVGLIQLGLRLSAGEISLGWASSAGVGMVAGLLLIGYFHQFRWVALPFFLGLIGLLAGVDRLGWTWPGFGMALAVWYVLLVWRGSVLILNAPVTGRLVTVLGFTVPGGSGGRRQMEDSLHRCALAVAIFAVIASTAATGSRTAIATATPALASTMLLFIVSSWYYRAAAQAVAALLILALMAWMIEGGWVRSGLLGLAQPLLNIGLSTAMALAWMALQRESLQALSYWLTPLRWVSAGLYLLALAGAILASVMGDARLSRLLVLLCLALFPVARPWRNASDWRGLGLALLSSGWVWSVADSLGLAGWHGAWIAIAWGYGLWFLSQLLLPYWNARQPDWAVAPSIWPLLGLLCVLSGAGFGFIAGIYSPATALAMLTPYLVLMWRDTAWPGITWLAIGALTASGLLIGVDLEYWPLWGRNVSLVTQLDGYSIAVLWLNVVWLLIPGCQQRYGRMIVHWLNRRPEDLIEPLFSLPFMALLVLLALLCVVEIGLFWAWSAETVPWLLVGAAALVAVTAAHAFTRRPQVWQAQVLLLALQAVIGAVILKLAPSRLWLPLLVALWDGVLLLVWRYGSGPRMPAWYFGVAFWLTVLPITSLSLLFLIPDIPWLSVTATLLVLAIVLLLQGRWQAQSSQIKIGLLLVLLASYTIWLPNNTVSLWLLLLNLAPWYALQTILLREASRLLQARLQTKVNTLEPTANSNQLARLYALDECLNQAMPGLWLLGLLWLGLHAGAVWAYQVGWGAWPWYFGSNIDALAAGTVLLLLVVRAALGAWRQLEQPQGVYATACLIGLSAAYIRLVSIGLAPFGVTDTAGLMVAAYGLFFLQQFKPSRPLYHLALLLPLLALITVPWQLASTWAGGTLVAAAVLYLSLATRLHNPLPFYLGVLALNAAIYLWAPLWAEHYNLWQLYIVPAAVSVLALLHLHRRELRPKVLSSARLAALSALYAGAGLDVFLRPELVVFVLALALALIGIILGIALRIRAFLYGGLAFLVLNVMGQLAHFYPEQSVSRALILIALGSLITVGMVVFNLKREEIMQRVRIMRADLAAWE